MNLRIGLLVLVVLVGAFAVWQLTDTEDPDGRVTRSTKATRLSNAPRKPPTAEAPTETTATPAELEPTAPFTVRGRVLAEGKPVADAYVYAIQEGDVADDFENTGPDGSFRLSATGELMIGAAHAKYGPVQKSVTATEGAVTEVVLELPASEVVNLVVLDRDEGKPVAGARVLLLRAGDGKAFEGLNKSLESVFDEVEETGDFDFSLLSHIQFAALFAFETVSNAVRVPLAVTDGAGRVRLTGLPKGTFDAVISHDGHVGARLRREAIQADRDVVVKLGKGGGLTVIAPLVDGRAAEGDSCLLQKGGLFAALPAGLKTIDASGKAVFPHLAPGAYKVTITKSGSDVFGFGFAIEVDLEVTEKGEEEEENEDRSIVTRPVRLAAGKMTTLDLRELKGARIEGTFLAGTKPAVNNMVILFGGKGLKDQAAMAQSNEEGKFVFEHVMPGRYRVAGEADGGVARADVEVSPGEAVVTVTLRTGSGSVSGAVVDAAGKPVVGASIFLVRETGKPFQVTSLADLMEVVAGQADSEENGKYRIDGVGAGSYRIVCGSQRRLAAGALQLHEGQQAQFDFRFEPGRQHELTVKLEGPDGTPVKGQLVIMGAAGSLVETMAISADDEEDMLLGKASNSVFRYEVAPGSYRISVRTDVFAQVLGMRVDVRQARELIVKLRRGVDAELRFVDDGEPVAGLDIDVRNADGFRVGAGSTLMEMIFEPRQLRSDEAGVVELPRLLPGRYTVHAGGKEIGSFRAGTDPVRKTIRR